MADKELILEITIPNYIRRVMTSESRRTKYYIFGKVRQKPIPAKFDKGIENGRYSWEVFRVLNKIPEKRLYDNEEKKFIIANPKVAGTQKWKVINGQDIYNNSVNSYELGSIMKAIKNFMLPHIINVDPLPIKVFPIRVLCELHDTIYDSIAGRESNTNRWDIDNRMYPYNKGFMDILSKHYIHKTTGRLKPFLEKGDNSDEWSFRSIIPDDDRLHVTQPPVPLFFPIEEGQDTKIVYKIYSDNRERIKNNRIYQSVLV